MNKPSIVCFGGAHLDRVGRVHGTYQPEQSNPGSFLAYPGGVARNVAENLGRMGVDCWLQTIVGDDENAIPVMESVSAAGLPVDGIAVSPNRATATYTAILSEGGKLILGLADMDIYDTLHCDLHHIRASSASHWFIDANLTAQDISRIAGEKADRVLIAAPVSPAKGEKLGSHLSKIDILFANIVEASRLIRDNRSGAVEDAVGAARGLRSLGVGAAVVTAGGDGVAVATAETTELIPAYPTDVISENGAGDAMSAGVLAGILRGDAILDAVRGPGRMAAKAALMVETAVSPKVADIFKDASTTMTTIR